MFKIDPKPTFTHTIDIKVPVDGGHEIQDCKVTYQVPVGGGDDQGLDPRHDDSVKEFLRERVIDISDITDEGGKALPFNDQVLEHMLHLPFSRVALLSGYFAGVSPAVSGN